MLRVVIFILFIAAIGFAVHCFFEFVLRRADRPKRGIVKPNAGLLVLGIISVVFLVGITYMVVRVHYDRFNLGMAVILGFFAAVGVMMIIHWFTFRIWYNETHFTVRNFWGKRRTYAYTDITGMYVGKSECLLMGKRKVEIIMYMEGGDRFLHIADKKYAQANDGKHIPDVKKLPGDIFNGRFEHAADYGVLTVIFLVAYLGFLMPLIIYPSDKFSEYFETTLYMRPVIRDDDMALYFKDQEAPFLIRQYAQYSQNTELIEENMGAQSKYYVNAEYHASTKTNQAFYHIINMTDNRGNVYVTYDMIWDQEAGRRKVFGIGGVIFFAVVAGYGALCVIACRNPEKHRRLMKICTSKWLWK